MKQNKKMWIINSYYNIYRINYYNKKNIQPT